MSEFDRAKQEMQVAWENEQKRKRLEEQRKREAVEAERVRVHEERQRKLLSEQNFIAIRKPILSLLSEVNRKVFDSQGAIFPWRRYSFVYLTPAQQYEDQYVPSIANKNERIGCSLVPPLPYQRDIGVYFSTEWRSSSSSRSVNRVALFLLVNCNGVGSGFSWQKTGMDPDFNELHVSVGRHGELVSLDKPLEIVLQEVKGRILNNISHVTYD